MLEGLISSLIFMSDTLIWPKHKHFGQDSFGTSTQCMTFLANFNSENPELSHLVCIAYRKYQTHSLQDMFHARFENQRFVRFPEHGFFSCKGFPKKHQTVCIYLDFQKIFSEECKWQSQDICPIFGQIHNDFDIPVL